MKKFLFSFMLIAGLLTLSGCGQKEDENALVILNYGKYIGPDVIQQFEKETGITIKYEEYESPEEMYTKYKAGSIKYDLICTFRLYDSKADFMKAKFWKWIMIIFHFTKTSTRPMWNFPRPLTRKRNTHYLISSAHWVFSTIKPW